MATRAASAESRIFALLSLAVAAWSSSIIVERLSTATAAVLVGHAVEELMAAVIIAGTAHLSLAIASESMPSTRRRRAVVAIYVANLAFAAPTIVSALTPVPSLTSSPLVGEVFLWTWIAVRLASLAIGASWLLQALRLAPPSSLRQRQVRAALATVATGGLGGGMRFLPVVGQLDAWIGVSMVALAVVFAAYAVFSAGVFFGPAVAGHAFRTSLIGALASFAVIAIVLGVDAVSRDLIGVGLPLFTAIALVVTVTLYEPVTQLLRQRLGGDGARGVARRRLLQAIGQSGPTARSAEAGVLPALTRLAGVLDVRGLAVARNDGRIVASEGSGAATAWIEVIPLEAAGEVVGELRVGATRSGAPLSPRDQELIRTSAAYVAAALRAGRREDEQVEQLAGLAEERAAVESKASTLHAALVQHADAPAGLHVHALGPLHVERAGERIERWGGDKAGTRQALGLFAFLLDRGERGLSKDEALELIWPDTDLERADLAFHRTMVGLRQTLDPRRDGRTSQVVRFHNDRYRLDASIVAWSDVAAFLERLDAAKSCQDPVQRLAILEQGRALYGGDYMDDCPFYGDSAEVEAQRAHLRGRATDVRIAIGEAYEALGDRLSAATAFREAIRGEPGGSAPAQTGLARLGI